MNPKKPRNKCRNCGNEVKHAVDVYCNSQCQADFQWTQRKLQIESSGKIPNNKIGRRYFLELYGNTCVICSSSTWRNEKIPLVLDHINGNPDDNILSNLRLICPNCDAQLPTYKSKNRGNGRAYRRQRYKEGKSY